jgi:cell division septation protein DedD
VSKPERAASPSAGPARRPAPRQPAAAPKAEGYTIQVGAFRQRARATTLVQSLKSAGFAAYLVVPSPNDPAAPYRVRVGTYPSPPDAEKDIEALESRLEQKVWLVAVEPPK